ncbi:hypothetical protein FQR65_LT18448 [Abscondita terminalis]|nr:hypothetical protein FQR65_LT18448 [Abscondita terminalis]
MLYRSGTEEEPDELYDLLRNISDLMNEFLCNQNKKQNASPFEKGFRHREKALSYTSESSVSSYVLENGSNELNGTNLDIGIVANEIVVDTSAPRETCSTTNSDETNKTSTTMTRASQKNIQSKGSFTKRAVNKIN